MAEHAAHITRPESSNRPSVFEVLAQDSLTATIRPALKHAVKVFAEKYPAQLGPLLRFYDEIFLTLDTVVQHHYLKLWGASFAENFYSLERVTSGKDGGTSQLDPPSKRHSLACLVLIPYLRTKLDSLFEDLQYKYPTTQWSSVIQRNISVCQRVSMFYLCLYPHLRSSWEFVSLLYTMSYMLKNGRWHSPSMHLAGVELTRATGEEVGGQSASDFGATSQIGFRTDDGSVMDRLSRLLRLSASTATVCLSYSVSVSVFFLQFLDWWYTSPDTHASSLTSLPIPQPPKVEKEKVETVVAGHCPLCMKPLTNSTALSVSGYVFCYPCIHQYVRTHQCCPLTGYPSSVDHLVKIYEQDV